MLSHLFLLQGLDRLILGLKISTIPGYGHTWFLSILAICYILMIFLRKRELLVQVVKNHRLLALLFCALIQATLVFFNIQIIYIVCFFVGYFWKKTFKISNNNLILLTIITISICTLRIIMKFNYDGTILYNHIISRVSFAFLGTWMIVGLYNLYIKVREIMDNIITSKVFKLLDLLSYPLFLTHYMFFNGFLATKIWIQGNVLQSIVAFVLMLLLSIILIYLTEIEKAKSIIYNS